jgi:DNA-binding GntR family transcriptional regulator
VHACWWARIMNDASDPIVPSNPAPDKCVELSAKLADAIELARLLPGQRISKANLALYLRAKPTDLEAVLPAFIAVSLLSLEGEDLVVAPLDRTKLMLQMHRREPLEKAIAEAAATKASAAQKGKIASAVVLLKRSALVGDMEGYMNADRALERLIGEAAALPDDFEKLVQIKREFRRAWCAHNRLRDLNIPANLREKLTQAIGKGDAAAAGEAVHRFLQYLSKAY